MAIPSSVANRAVEIPAASWLACGRGAGRGDHPEAQDHPVDRADQADHRAERADGRQVGRPVLHLHRRVVVGHLHRPQGGGQARGELAHARGQRLPRNDGSAASRWIRLGVPLLRRAGRSASPTRASGSGDRSAVLERHPGDQGDQVERHRQDDHADRPGGPDHPVQERLAPLPRPGAGLFGGGDRRAILARGPPARRPSEGSGSRAGRRPRRPGPGDSTDSNPHLPAARGRPSRPPEPSRV